MHPRQGFWSVNRSTNEFVYENSSKSEEPVESIVQYGRPILEDGEIEFESYYVPKESEAHPSIGDCAWILREDSLTGHRITLNRRENAEAVEKLPVVKSTTDKIPMKPNAWNNIKVTLAGDDVMLSVNGIEVGRSKLASPPSHRHFGLFHFGNRTNAKVRNIKYRGKWPTSLPEIKDQFLAGPFRRSSNDESTPPQLNQSFASVDMEKLLEVGWKRLGAEECLKPSASGISSKLTNAQNSQLWPGLTLSKSFSGDGIIDVGFQDLTLKQGKEGWGVNAGVFVQLDDAEQSDLELVLIQYQNGETSVQTVLRRKNPKGETAAVHRTSYEVGKINSGRFRLERVGSRFDLMISRESSGDFELVDQIATSVSPIRTVTLQSRGSDNEGLSEVVWTNAKIIGFSSHPKK